MSAKAKDTLLNFTMYIGFLLINSIWLPIAYNLYVFVHRSSLTSLGDQWWLGRAPLWHWLLLFVFDDFCFYWFHRTSHKIPLLWASHVTHHSSLFFNLSVGFRQTWVPFFAVLFWIPLAWIGFDPLMIMTMQFLSLLFQAFLHTEKIRSYGALDVVLNSPSHHRVHHGTQAPYIDRNFGGVLIVWDRLFGTFTPEQETPVYGIGSFQGNNPFKIAFGEFWQLARRSRRDQ